MRYEYEAMGRSFSLNEVADGYQLRTHSEYGSYILKMLQTSPNRLSRAAMETLSIIAYKQPILRQDVEKFRGVDVGGILRTLLEKGLVRIMGRKDLPGRPLIYGTTKKFLEVFDLKDLKSLPKLKEIKDLGLDEFERGTPEQLALTGMIPPSDDTQDDSEQDDSAKIAGEEFAVNGTEETTRPEETGEEVSQGTETGETTETDEEHKPGSPVETSDDVSAEQQPAEAISPEESGDEASAETESEETSLRQDADEEASHSIGADETKKTTPDQTGEEAPPTDKPSPEESRGLDTSRRDSGSEDF